MTCVNGLSLYLRTRRAVGTNAELARGYATLVRGWFFWMNLPWVVMGLGGVMGGAPTVFHFLSPRTGDPWVIAWWVSLAAVYVVTGYWIFRRNGAEVVSRLPMPQRRHPLGGGAPSPAVTKLYVGLMMAPGLVAFVVLLVTDPPLPPF